MKLLLERCLIKRCRRTVQLSGSSIMKSGDGQDSIHINGNPDEIATWCGTFPAPLWISMNFLVHDVCSNSKRSSRNWPETAFGIHSHVFQALEPSQSKWCVETVEMIWHRQNRIEGRMSMNVKSGLFVIKSHLPSSYRWLLNCEDPIWIYLGIMLHL